MIEPTLFFKCIADETRMRATLLIHAEGELCVCELVEALEDSQPKISRHLAQLRSSGLLTDSRRGQWVFYSINTQLPTWCFELLDVIYDAQKDELKIAQTNLRTMGSRPQCC